MQGGEIALVAVIRGFHCAQPFQVDILGHFKVAHPAGVVVGKAGNFRIGGQKLLVVDDGFLVAQGGAGVEHGQDFQHAIRFQDVVDDLLIGLGGGVLDVRAAAVGTEGGDDVEVVRNAQGVQPLLDVHQQVDALFVGAGKIQQVGRL